MQQIEDRVEVHILKVVAMAVHPVLPGGHSLLKNKYLNGCSASSVPLSGISKHT